MIHSSRSSSRTPSPISRRRNTTNTGILEDIISIITIIFSITLIILIPYVILSTLKGNCHQYAIHAAFICSILFHFIMVIHKLITSEKHNFLTVWYNIHFHYFLNNIFLYYSRLNLFPFFISVGTRSFFALFKNLDNIYSNKPGENARIVLSFTKPVINSIQLHRFASILEILELPCLIVLAFIVSRNIRVLAVLSVNFFFLLMCYQTDPYHRWVWQSMRKFFIDRAHKHRDSFGNFLFKIVSLFDFYSDFAQFLFPPIKGSVDY